ncbi:MAG: ABC transporter substrate-binding protein [Nitrospirales bacterium]|nr:MAG: ABC transporter substrate-binding protein [Nitrospirales bacterium]
MKRVQSSGSFRPWGFFIFVIRYEIRHILAGLLCCVMVWGASVSSALAADDSLMKRRQQGILTGMPFMANLAPRTFIDDMGRKLFLAKHPTRIISLAPSITEILFAIGLNEEIVGVTEFCDYPPQAKDKTVVGYAQPNIESIVALKPDLVLAPKSFMRADLLRKLEQLKIPTFILEPHTVEEIMAHIKLLGRMVGRSDAANEQTTSLRKQIAQLSDQLKGRARPSLLYILNSEPLITVGPGSFIHHLIELAGGRNAAEAATTPYPRLTMEEVLRQNPDILLFPVGRFEGIPQAEQDRWKRWETLTAVKKNYLFQVQSDLLNRPGPRIIEGLKQLVRFLHPEVLQNETMNQRDD